MSRYSVTREELIDAIANIEIRNVRTDGPAKGLAVADDLADAILLQLSPEAAAGDPPVTGGMREFTCGLCGGVFGTNWPLDEVQCAHCEARRCPSCRTWFGAEVGI